MIFDQAFSMAEAEAEAKGKGRFGSLEINNKLEELIKPILITLDLTNETEYSKLLNWAKNYRWEEENDLTVAENHTILYKSGTVQALFCYYLPIIKEQQHQLLKENKAVSELLEVSNYYLLHLKEIRTEKLKKNPLLIEKFEQCNDLIKILKEDKPSLEKLEACEKKIKEYKSHKKGLVQHRNPRLDKAENVLRGFLAFLATASGILAPFVAYKAYRGTLFKRTAGEQMLERSEKIIQRYKSRN